MLARRVREIEGRCGLIEGATEALERKGRKENPLSTQRKGLRRAIKFGAYAQTSSG
jgi:hypothetical protein